MKLNTPEKLQSLTVEEMETVAAAVDAHWAAMAQDGFSIGNPKLLAPLFAMFVTAIGYGFLGDLGDGLPFFRVVVIFCELGFFGMFCLVAGQLAWNHWSRSSLIKSARDIGVDVATLGEPALERWVLQPLRAQEHSGTSVE